MFYKAIATQTADHLRTHLQAYLQIYSDLNDVPLIMPKKIEVGSPIGGVIREEDVPTYSVDCLAKVKGEDTDEDLNVWVYNGQITGLVAAGTGPAADLLAKGHAGVCERFVRQHMYLPISGADFTVIEMAYTAVDISTALEVETDWLCGFRVEVWWKTSEDAAFQHG